MSNKSIVILGGGESGVGTALFAKQQGYQVFLSDFGTIADSFKAELDKHQIAWEEGKHSKDRILKADVVIKSPGIPQTAPVVVSVKEAEIPVYSEIEWAASHVSAKYVCITGSNGKTTTTSLVGKLLENAGMSVGVGGNIGRSLARQIVEDGEKEIYVLELSSFQLDDMVNFKPDVAVLLNITPDHLDRYEYKLENYAKSKFSITKNQTDSDYFIYCADDEITAQFKSYANPSVQEITFSADKPLAFGGYIENENLIVHLKKKPQ